ncbi:MAG: acetyl-CoA carboxylase biotin carboxyl carrier protein subunit [Gemmatimonadota bacterium]
MVGENLMEGGHRPDEGPGGAGRRYHVRIGEAGCEATVADGGLWIGDRFLPARLTRLPGNGLPALRIDGRTTPFHARLSGSSWLIEVEGRVFRVEVEDLRRRALRELAGGGRQVATEGVVRAPMPGLIVQVEVEVNEEVAAGTPLVIMEAMKMENEIKAGAAGTVKEVLVRAGDVVNQGDVLLRLS